MSPLPEHATPLDFSLFGGGPWSRLEKRLGLDRPISASWPYVSRFLAALLIAWVPLAVLSALQGGDAFDAFISDKLVQAQSLFALPILVACQPYTDGRIRIAASRPIRMGLLTPADASLYQLSLYRAARWRDTWIIPALLLVVALGYSIARFRFTIGGQPALGAAPDRPITPAIAWYFAVTLPLYWFTALMWAWRFLIWSEILYRLSRLNLQIVTTHADRTGGVGFLPKTQASFAPLVFALGAVLTSITDIPATAKLSEGLLNYSKSHSVFAATAFVVLNLPLASFAPRLLAAKRESDARFSELIAVHARAFQQRWFDRDNRPDPLARNDFSAMIDLSSSYQMAVKMRWFPFSFRASVGIVGAAVGSLVPRLLMQHQFLETATGLIPRLF